MKKLSIILSLFIVITSCKGNENKTSDTSGNKSAKQEKSLKRYDIKSGMITYKTIISGKVMGGTVSGSGTQSLYFKNWGALELSEEESDQTTTVVVFGNKNVQKTHSHIMNKLDNGESYHADFDKKQIYIGRDPMMDFMKQSNTDAGDAGKKMLESIGGKQLSNEKFMGYDCEVWSIMGGKQWLYKGVMLKIEMSVMGILTISEATSAKFDVSVADKYFELPDFPVQKEEGFMNNEDFQDDMEDMDANMDQLEKMSFEEWKKLAVADDEEMNQMSDEELHQTYDMIQKMIKMRKGK